MPGMGVPANGVPPWRAALEAKKAAMNNSDTNNTSRRGPPIPTTKPSIPIRSSSFNIMDGASVPQAPPRNETPVLSLAEAVSFIIRDYFRFIDFYNID